MKQAAVQGVLSMVHNSMKNPKTSLCLERCLVETKYLTHIDCQYRMALATWALLILKTKPMVCYLNLNFSGKIQHPLTTPHIRILGCKRRYRRHITKHRTIIMNKNMGKSLKRTSPRIQIKPCLIAKIKLHRTK